MKDPSAKACVGDVLDEYLKAVEAGSAPDREALLARHPDLAEELAAAFLGLDFVRGAAPSLGGEDSGDGKALGDYRLLREIGRGGMAVVYEAEQVSLGRRVALKVLPFAAVLEPKHLQRFKNEALAAAHLQHPHIVPVHAVGSERGVHYYAMQYIEGQSLAAAIKDLKGGGGGRSAEERPPGSTGEGPDGPRSPISSHGSNRETAYIRMAAALGAQAAEALDHAHQLGIVHRDVKPGNLLVDQAGKLWVADFGLARSIHDAGLTGTGELLGTIRYMSPEQALAKRAPVDHRTDVYSLGATLYELFTLEAAFPGDDPHRVIQDIASKEPVSPRKLNPALPQDLETILLKAMEKDAARRYPTAQEMADDLRRFLDERPIQARPPTVPDRAWKWARRHRSLVLASSVVLLLTTVGLGVGAALLAREKRRTSDEQRRTRAALDRAKENLSVAHEAVNKFLLELGIGGGGLTDEPLPTPARQALLRKALELYDAFLADEEEAGTFARHGQILDGLHRYQEAIASFDRAIALNPNVALVHHCRGCALYELRRFDDALAACDRSIALDPDSALAHSTRGHALYKLGRFEGALAAFDRSIAIDPDRANVHSSRGAALHSLGRFEDALDACDRSIAIDPDLAAAHANRGQALHTLGRFDEALAAFDRALAIDPDLATAHSNRGCALLRLGRSGDAIAAFDRALAIDPDSAAAHSNRGQALHTLGRFEDAIGACDRALVIDQDCAPAHANRGDALHSLGRVDDALAAFDRAIAIDPDCAVVHAARGGALLSLGRFDDALAAFDRSISIDPDRATVHSNRGFALRSLRRFDDALAAFDRALAIDPNDAGLHSNRGAALLSLRRFDDALAACDRALAIDPNKALAHHNRGDALTCLRRTRDALAAYDREIDLSSRPPPTLLNSVAWLRATSPDPEVRDVARAVKLAKAAVRLAAEEGSFWNTLGVALCEAEQWEDALRAFDKSMELCDGGDANDWFFVAMALWQLGRKDEARGWYDKAVAWLEQNKPADDEDLKRFRARAAALLGVR